MTAFAASRPRAWLAATEHDASPRVFRRCCSFSPLSGNTPYEDLISDSCYDADIVLILPGHRCDPQLVNADVIVNLVSEADLRRDIVEQVANFVDSLENPVINHPQLILCTDRESIAQRLAGIAGTVVPATIRLDAAALYQFLSSNSLPSFNLIARHAGTHGGDKMELISTLQELRAFARRRAINRSISPTSSIIGQPTAFTASIASSSSATKSSLSSGNRRCLESPSRVNSYG